MRKLIVSMNVTLDGYLSGPSCELDWHFQNWTQEMGDALCCQLAKADTLLFGRVTYDAMARYWPGKMLDLGCQREDFALADMMNRYAKIVFSKTLHAPTWNNSRVVRGKLDQQIRALKRESGKEIMVYGSGKLVNGLAGCDLVDEYQLWIHPVVLGAGKLLFNSSEHRLNLRMLNMKKFDSGVVMLHYETIARRRDG